MDNDLNYGKVISDLEAIQNCFVKYSGERLSSLDTAINVVCLKKDDTDTQESGVPVKTYFSKYGTLIKKCGNCEKEIPCFVWGHWNYCPWCGKKFKKDT